MSALFFAPINFQMFNYLSTHPRGVRRRTIALRCRNSRFNPRTHVGCDNLQFYFRRPLCVSIHAPMWGATLIRCQTLRRHICFNSRTHVGCDIFLTKI